MHFDLLIVGNDINCLTTCSRVRQNTVLLVSIVNLAIKYPKIQPASHAVSTASHFSFQGIVLVHASSENLRNFPNGRAYLWSALSFTSIF